MYFSKLLENNKDRWERMIIGGKKEGEGGERKRREHLGYSGGRLKR